MRYRHLFFVLSATVSLVLSTAYAAPPNGKGKGGTKAERFGGDYCMMLRDLPTDGLLSDGIGSYCDLANSSVGDDYLFWFSSARSMFFDFDDVVTADPADLPNTDFYRATGRISVPNGLHTMVDGETRIGSGRFDIQPNPDDDYGFYHLVWNSGTWGGELAEQLEITAADTNDNGVVDTFYIRTTGDGTAKVSGPSSLGTSGEYLGTVRVPFAMTIWDAELNQ
jgi:hypothetical protein